MNHIEAATINELYEAAIEKRRGEERSSRWVAILGLRPMREGNQWLFLYGENRQEGVSGVGDTPEAAAEAFDFAMTQHSGTNVGALKEQPMNKAETTEVMHAFADCLRILYKEAGIEIPDKFYPGREAKRLKLNLTGFGRYPCGCFAGVGDDLQKCPTHAASCPICGAPEVGSKGPLTTYECGSTDYDQREGTFKRGLGCE